MPNVANLVSQPRATPWEIGPQIPQGLKARPNRCPCRCDSHPRFDSPPLARPFRAWKIICAPFLGRCPRLAWSGPLALRHSRSPPLAEQRRIVAKGEQLMALVDALETQLGASRTTIANLLSALVAELTTAEPG